MSKQVYHPLKMHGSYIGLVLGFVLSYLGMVGLSVMGEFSLLKPGVFLVMFTPLIIGFLFGWVFHSIIKAMKK
jgi:hypothetical protein